MKFLQPNLRSALMVVAGLTLSSRALSFTAPIGPSRSFGVVPHQFGSVVSSPLHMAAPVSFLPEDATAVSSAIFSSTALFTSDVDVAGVVDTIRSIAVALTAIVFGLAGLTLLMANIIIPAAAKELEKECLELSPDLWKEYQAKLEPGQTMANRPDLMQELGAKLQPLLDAKIAGMQMQQEQGGSSTTTLPIAPAVKTNDDDDEAWTTTVDLSAITNQIEVPAKKKEEDREL